MLQQTVALPLRPARSSVTRQSLALLAACLRQSLGDADTTATINDTTEQSPKSEVGQSLDSERTKQVTVAGWTAGLSALFACCALGNSPTWPMAFGGGGSCSDGGGCLLLHFEKRLAPYAA